MNNFLPTEFIEFFVKNLSRAWERNSGHERVFIATGSAVAIIGFALGGYARANQLPQELMFVGIFACALSLLTLMVVASKEEMRSSEKTEKKIEELEAKAQANPEKPTYAWDLARVKLEKYLDRNLSEVRSIFILTTLVMLAGFGLVLFGLIKAYSDPANFQVSIVGAASGVLLSFVGGSFLLIYRSVLAQSANYVQILERINAVGMAVQIATTVSDNEPKLKAETTASLAISLLTLYGKPVSSEKDMV
jgi:Na+/proline symporter